MYFRHVSKYYEHANTFVIMVQLREGLWQGQGGISFQDFFYLKMFDFLKPYMIYFNNQITRKEEENGDEKEQNMARHDDNIDVHKNTTYLN